MRRCIAKRIFTGIWRYLKMTNAIKGLKLKRRKLVKIQREVFLNAFKKTSSKYSLSSAEVNDRRQVEMFGISM